MRLLRRWLILPVGMVLGSAPGNASAQAPVRAQVNYMLHCQGCHLADGAGVPGIVPAMQNSVDRLLSTPAGRDFLVQVPGVAQAPLDDAELAELMNWLLLTMSSGQLPDNFQPYTENEVRQLRARPLVDVSRVRAALMATPREHPAAEDN